MKLTFACFILSAAFSAPAIFAQNQPAPAPAPAKKHATVNQRRENQQDRIAQGVKSGQLSAKETANLENKEAKINKEVHNDRKANGGNLTNKQRKQINRQQNKVSDQIYDDKHNAQKQPK